MNPRDVALGHARETGQSDRELGLAGQCAGVAGTILALFVALIATQRLAISVSGVPITSSSIVALTLIAAAYRTGFARFHPGRLIAWFCLVVLVAASVAGAKLAGDAASIPGAAAFVCGTLLLTLEPSRDVAVREACAAAVARGFLVVGLVVAVVVGFQWVTQLAHGIYLDPIAWLPEEILLSGYNTRATVSYGSELARPNGVLFLEPSIASQFLGLALISVYLRRDLRPKIRSLALGILLLGLLLTFSGTGLIVFGVGWVFAARAFDLARVTVVAAVCATLLLTAVGLGSLGNTIVSERVRESTGSAGSGQARFVLPYQTVLRGGHSPSQLLFGRGPGSGDVRVSDEFAQSGRYMWFNVLLKLYWEYGILVGLLFCAWLVGMVRRFHKTQAPMGWAILAQYLLLTGSLVFAFEPALLVLIAVGAMSPVAPRLRPPALATAPVPA